MKVTSKTMVGLLNVSMRNGTEHAAIAIAKDWIEAADAEIVRLQGIANRAIKVALDTCDD